MSITTTDLANWSTDLSTIYNAWKKPSTTQQPVAQSAPVSNPGNAGKGGISIAWIVGGVAALIVGAIAIKKFA